MDKGVSKCIVGRYTDSRLAVSDSRPCRGGRGVYGVCNCTAKASVMTETWERGGTEKNFIGFQGEENE